MTHPVTVVVTSCGRHDLLERTMDSFFVHNTYPIQEIIIREDDPKQDIGPLREKYGEAVRWIQDKKLGQIDSIDVLMAQVNTEWVFHLEDDWEFYRPGFIEASFETMEHANFITCWLREQGDTNGHPVIKGCAYDFMDPHYKWSGFTFNPGLRRMSDYHKIGSYRKAVGRKDGAGAEQRIGNIYRDMGYIAAITKQGYVRHIGNGRHVK